MATAAASIRRPRPDTAGLEVALVERALCDGGVLFSRATPGPRCFYRLTLQPTLFGGLDLVREWGRVAGGWTGRARPAGGQAGRRRLVEHYPGVGEAVSPLGEAVRLRLRHGYRARALPARFIPSAPAVLWCPRPPPA